MAANVASFVEELVAVVVQASVLLHITLFDLVEVNSDLILVLGHSLELRFFTSVPSLSLALCWIGQVLCLLKSCKINILIVFFKPGFKAVAKAEFWIGNRGLALRESLIWLLWTAACLVSAA